LIETFIPAELAILAGLLLALGLFVRMAISAGTVRSLQFQLAGFLSIWCVSEIPRVLNSIGVIDLSSISIYGMLVHTVSMLAFTGFIVYRFSRFVSGAK